jgi:hypothetical protein
MVSKLVLSEVEGVEPSNPITIHRSPFTNHLCRHQTKL